MKRRINLSSLSKETQAAVKKEIAAKKVVAAKPLSEEAKAWLDRAITSPSNAHYPYWGKTHWTLRGDGKIDAYASLDFDKKDSEDFLKFVGNEVFFGKVDKFLIYNIPVSNLKGFPEEVTNEFSVYGTAIRDLIGGPSKVGGSYSVSNNKKLTSLEGAPKVIPESFDCRWCSLASLEGGPERVEWTYYAEHNKLSSLKGVAQYIGSNLDVSDNPALKSLDGVGKVGGKISADFKVVKSPKYVKEELEGEAAGELEDALNGLIDNTQSFYKFDEDGEFVRRTDSKIKAYIKTKLFSEISLPKALELFMENPELAMQEALDGHGMSDAEGMIDDENWDDFLTDMEEAAEQKLAQLKAKKKK